MTRNGLCLAVLIALLGSVHLATLRGGHEWGDDFSLYVSHARNLVEGRPYAETGYIYNPQNPIVSPRTYPPIFPVLLAPVYQMFGVDLAVMKAFGVLLFTALLGVLAVVYRKRLPLPYTLGCLALFGLNPYVWQHKDRLLSETPFMLFAYLALLAVERGWETAATRKQSLVWGFLAGLATYLAFGTRTVGIVLLPSMVGCELLRRRRVGLVSLTAAAVFLAGVCVQKSLLILEGSYLDQVIVDPKHLVETSVALVKGLGLFVGSGYSRYGCAALYGGVLLLAGAGYLARLRNGTTVYEWFAASNCLLLIFWPPFDTAALRFLLPILPLFFLYVGEGLCLLGRSSIRRAAVPIACALTMAVLVSYAGWYTRLERGPVVEGVSSPQAVALFDWIRADTDPDAVFLFQKPRALALFCRRHAVAHHPADKEQQLRQLMQTAGVTHVVIAQTSSAPSLQTSRKKLQPYLAQHQAHFEKVYENPGFRVYRLRSDELASR